MLHGSDLRSRVITVKMLTEPTESLKICPGLDNLPVNMCVYMRVKEIHSSACEPFHRA